MCNHKILICIWLHYAALSALVPKTDILPRAKKVYLILVQAPLATRGCHHSAIKPLRAAVIVFHLEHCAISTRYLWSSLGSWSPLLTCFTWLLSFARGPALGRVLVVPHFFHFIFTEATALLKTFTAADFFFFTLSQILSELCRQFLQPHGLAFALALIGHLRGLLQRPYHVMSNQFHLLTVGFSFSFLINLPWSSYNPSIAEQTRCYSNWLWTMLNLLCGSFPHLSVAIIFVGGY